MECRDCKIRMPEYLAGSLLPDDTVIFKAHLNHCPLCRDELASFRELNRVINAAGIDIPEADLTQSIMERLNAGSREIKPAARMPGSGRRKRIASLVQDLVAAAAAAIIIFWFAGPVPAGNSVPKYTQEVVKVNSSVGGAFHAYIDFSASTVDKLFDTIKQIGPGQRKGDEKF